MQSWVYVTIAKKKHLKSSKLERYYIVKVIYLTNLELDRNKSSMVTSRNAPHYFPSSRNPNLGRRLLEQYATFPSSISSTSRLFTKRNIPRNMVSRSNYPPTR